MQKIRWIQTCIGTLTRRTLGLGLFVTSCSSGSQRVINEAESDVLASIVRPADQEVMVTFVSTAKRFRSTSGPSRARAASERLKL